MSSSGSFLRQLSGREEVWKSASRRWGGNPKKYCGGGGGGCKRSSLEQMEELNIYGNCGGSENYGAVVRKRVMVLVDQTSHSKHAMMFALTHVANNGDFFTLLHVIPPTHKGSDCSSSHCLANSLGSLCKACKPEVEVEALVIQGPKLSTVLSQVKKLEVSVLVLGKKRPSPFLNCLHGTSSNEFVDQCINNADCLTVGVRKQSSGVGGYLISTRWQKNFWLLA
ncbi:hypothetical protein SLE2022_183710 [Rubroshorea leprosula]